MKMVSGRFSSMGKDCHVLLLRLFCTLLRKDATNDLTKKPRQDVHHTTKPVSDPFVKPDLTIRPKVRLLEDDFSCIILPGLLLLQAAANLPTGLLQIYRSSLLLAYTQIRRDDIRPRCSIFSHSQVTVRTLRLATKD